MGRTKQLYVTSLSLLIVLLLTITGFNLIRAEAARSSSANAGRTEIWIPNGSGELHQNSVPVQLLLPVTTASARLNLSVDDETPTPDLTATPTPLATWTHTPTSTVTITPTATISLTFTATITATPTPTATLPVTFTATGTTTPSPTLAPSPTGTPSATPTPSETPEGYWTCEQSDVNLDVIIDILDISLVAQNIFQNGSPGWIPEDVNLDGAVNVLDLTSAGACMDVLPTPTFTPTITPTPVPEAHVYIQPGSQTVANGQNFTVKMILDTIAPSRAAQFGLTFDPAVIRCNAVTEGTFYSDWAEEHDASTLVLPQGVCDNVNGKVSVMGITLLGSSGGPSGQGEVATFEFTAIANGSSPLTLQEVIVANADPENTEALPLRITNGQVSVENTAQPTATSTRTPPWTATSTPTTPAPGNPTATRTPLRTPTRTPFRTATQGGGGNPTATRTSAPTSVATTAVGTTSAATATRDVTLTAPVNRTNTPEASSARIFFQPSLKTVASGETFTVDVVIETDKATRSAMMRIAFDANVLECQDVEEGPFYKSWATDNGGSTFLNPNPPVIDNAGGKIQDFGITILGADVDPSPSYTGGPKGSGVFVKLTFRAKANGTSALQMENVVMGDDYWGESRPLRFTTQSGQVFVGITPTPTQQGAATATSTPTLPGGSSGGEPTSSVGSGQTTPTLPRTTALPTPTPKRTTVGAYPAPTMPAGSITMTPAGSVSAPAASATTVSQDTGVITSTESLTQTTTFGKAYDPTGGDESSTEAAESASVDISAQLDASGITTEEVIVQSQDGLCILNIPADTQALTADNYPLKQISLQSLLVDSLPTELQTNLGGTVCEYGPPGGNFYPPALISLAYNPENLPPDARETGLKILLLDEATGEWQVLDSTIDTASHTVSTEVEHFSIYSIQAAAPSFNWIPIIIASLFLEAIAGLGIYFYIRYRRDSASRVTPKPPLLLPPVAGEKYVFPEPEIEYPEEKSPALIFPKNHRTPPAPKSHSFKENE